MDKRDLKADLEVVQKAKEFEKITGWGSEEFIRLAPYFRNFHENGIAIAVHALERAIEAESLVRDLVEALGMVLEEMANCGFEVEEIFDPEKVVHAFGVFEKTKEVLGECSTANNAE